MAPANSFVMNCRSSTTVTKLSCRNRKNRCGGLGLPPPFLHNHYLKILVHINPESACGRTRPVASLMTALLPLNWQRVPSCEDNSVVLLSLYIRWRTH
jgi:hypothetical protein